jgi:hypothetical protein
MLKAYGSEHIQNPIWNTAGSYAYLISYFSVLQSAPLQESFQNNGYAQFVVVNKSINQYKVAFRYTVFLV